MKKIISRSVVTVLSIMTLVSSATSQELALNKKATPTTVIESKEVSSDIPYINNVKGKVLKSFHKSFGEKPGAIWTKSENGFVVYFKDSTMATNVYFTNSGAIDYKINYYHEDQLRRDVRHTIKSNFYDYYIRLVSEVHKDGTVFYFVKIEDKDSIKTIRVVDQEWQVVEEITKQVPSISTAKNSF